MLKIIGPAIVVAALSTNVQAANMGDIMALDKNPHIMMAAHKESHVIKMHCKHFIHRAHGKCASMMKIHKMKHHMMIKY